MIKRFKVYKLIFFGNFYFLFNNIKGYIISTTIKNFLTLVFIF